MRSVDTSFVILLLVLMYTGLWVGGCDFPYQLAYGLGELARAVADGYGRQ